MSSRVPRSMRGQATVEYVIVGIVVIIVAVGLAALWRYASGAGFAALPAEHASHALGELEGAADVLLY